MLGDGSTHECCETSGSMLVVDCAQRQLLAEKKINPIVKNLKILCCMVTFKLLLKCKIANNKIAKVSLRIFIYSWILVCAFGNIRTSD